MRTILVLTLTTMSVFAADNYTLTRPSVEFNAANKVTAVVVRVGAPRPGFSALQPKGVWAITAFSTGGSILPAEIASVGPLIVNSQDMYPLDGSVRLELSHELQDVASITVALLLGSVPSVTWHPKDPSAPNTGHCGWNQLGFNAVEKRSQSDVYLSGSITAGIGAKPLYNIDADITAPICTTKALVTNLGGTIKTADHKNLDPDSFTAFVELHPQFPVGTPGLYRYWDWKAANWEFSRDDQFLNFVTAPSYTVSLGKPFLNPTTRRVISSIDLDLSAGVEAGKNLRSGSYRSGYGTIFRLAPSASLYWVMPRLKLKISSTYQPRILTTKEPFLDTRNGFASLARGTRQNWSNQIAYGLTSLASITVKHTYGSEPPAFKIIDHRVTVGIEVMWSWRQ